MDSPEQQIYEMVASWHGRCWWAFNKTPLTAECSLNHTLNIDAEEAEELLEEIFERFHLEQSDLDFRRYFPPGEEKGAPPLTIAMLIASAKAGAWLYD